MQIMSLWLPLSSDTYKCCRSVASLVSQLPRIASELWSTERTWCSLTDREEASFVGWVSMTILGG